MYNFFEYSTVNYRLLPPPPPMERLLPMVRPPPALMDLDEDDMFDVDGRVDERLDVPVDGRVEAEAPFPRPLVVLLP